MGLMEDLERLVPQERLEPQALMTHIAQQVVRTPMALLAVPDRLQVQVQLHLLAAALEAQA